LPLWNWISNNSIIPLRGFKQKPISGEQEGSGSNPLKIEKKPWLYYHQQPMTAKATAPTLTPSFEIGVAERAGLEDVRFHDLRHTFARFTITVGS
jgi:hypothetical protein